MVPEYFNFDETSTTTSTTSSFNLGTAELSFSFCSGQITGKLVLGIVGSQAALIIILMVGMGYLYHK